MILLLPARTARFPVIEGVVVVVEDRGCRFPKSSIFITRRRRLLPVQNKCVGVQVIDKGICETPSDVTDPRFIFTRWIKFGGLRVVLL